MKKSKIICALLIVAMLLSYCSFTFAVVVDNDNGKMKYYKKSYSAFDVKGYVNNALQSTTFMDSGYESKLKVDNNEAEDMNFYENQEQVINGIAWDIECSFINNGRYVKIAYTLTNNNASTSTISLGTYADVQIAGNDRATIERFENSNGLRLYDDETNIQFSFYGKSVAGTTDVDNLWIGEYPYEEDNCFNHNTIDKIQEEDSAFAFSWVNRTIEPGETKKYSVIIGMGEVSNAPKIELDQNQGRCFSQDSVVINGTISDLDANSKATLYYTIDDGEENTLDEATLTNNKLDFTLDLTSQNLSVGTHKIELWAIDESGNPSEILEKEILITNLKAPVLNMSEDWSNQNVTFTITDELNSADDVLKYQYKIGDGEWQDASLNTEIVALQETGTVVVMAKVLGKQTDEQSSIVSKTAKVDKNGPQISVTEQNQKITITATDEQSGVDSVKYLLTTVRDLTGEEQFADYAEPIDCAELEAGDLYLHVKAKDKLANESVYTKEYKEPVIATIVTEEEFKNEKPTYKLTDENRQFENNYIYQVKINDGEWQDVNIDTEYTIAEPVIGKNTIKTRTIDSLGRISEETQVEVTYIEEKVVEDTDEEKETEDTKDETIADKLLPDTGTGRIMLSILIISILGTIGYIRYKKLKDIK